jgi:hypothetical protein
LRPGFQVSDLPVHAIFAKSRESLAGLLPTTQLNYLALVPTSARDRATFYIYAISNDDVLLLDEYRLFFSGEPSAPGDVLYRLMGDKRFLEFPLFAVQYTGLAASDALYKRLSVPFTRTRAVQALRSLHDLVVAESDAPGTTSRLSDQARRHLVPGSAAQRALHNGAGDLGLSMGASEITSFTATLTAPEYHEYSITFDFAPSDLPSNIVVLIGKNGSNKTQCIEHLADELSGQQRRRASRYMTVQAEPRPTFSQIVTISLSPFERFPLQDETLSRSVRNAGDIDSITPAYVYIGLRDSRGRLALSAPKSKAVDGLCAAILATRSPFRGIDPARLEIMLETLRMEFTFDSIAVTLTPRRGKDRRSQARALTVLRRGDVIDVSGAREVLAANDHDRDLTLVLDGAPVYLSAGQWSFLFLVFGLAGHLASNSLVLIDEPELSLHPELQVKMIALLKNLLERFDARCIIATHSGEILREMPRRQVRILTRDGNSIIVRSPRIETFGADLSDVNEEVFENNAVPPFEGSLERYARTFGSFGEFLRAASERRLPTSAISYVRNTVFVGDGE